jgi:hypothetical protein
LSHFISRCQRTGDRVCGQHVLTPAHDDRGHGELIDEFGDRRRNLLLRRVVSRGGRVSELMQVGGRFGVHAQCPGDRVEDFG